MCNYMKAFDFEAACRGAPVVTSGGDPVRLLCFDNVDVCVGFSRGLGDGNYLIVGLVNIGGADVTMYWDRNGVNSTFVNFDLFMFSESVELHSQVYVIPSEAYGDRHVHGGLYPSYAECVAADRVPGHVMSAGNLPGSVVGCLRVIIEDGVLLRAEVVAVPVASVKVDGA